jgi:2-octaprenylphenol hydroxylase
MPAQINPEFDVVVAGAGMIGCTCAALIAQSGVRVALVDPNPIKLEHNRPNQVRVSALNLSTETILCALGAWPFLKAESLSPFRQIDVWDENSNGQITFSAADVGLSHLGHIIPNQHIRSALIARMAQLNTLDCLPGQRIEAFDANDSAIRITLSSGRTTSCQLLIGADGTASTIRSLAQISVDKYFYDHKAIVATIITDKPHHEIARQIFLDTGPLALLPLKDGRSSIVWSCSLERFDELEKLDNDAFSTALSRASEYRLGTIRVISRRASFFLIRQHAQRYIAPRVALIGDAAHTIHPLAGLGANIGFSDAKALAKVVNHTSQQGRDIGNYSVLRRYERERRGGVHITSSFMDILDHSFKSSHPLVRTSRGFGFNLINNLDPLKSILIR